MNRFFWSRHECRCVYHRALDFDKRLRHLFAVPMGSAVIVSQTIIMLLAIGLIFVSESTGALARRLARIARAVPEEFIR